MMEKHQEEHSADLHLSCLTLKEYNGVAVVTFDDPDSKVNTLNSKLIPQFEEVLAHVENSSNKTTAFTRCNHNGFYGG